MGGCEYSPQSAMQPRERQTSSRRTIHRKLRASAAPWRQYVLNRRRNANVASIRQMSSSHRAAADAYLTGRTAVASSDQCAGSQADGVPPAVEPMRHAFTVRDHWRCRSRIPVPRPNSLRRSVGAHVGRTQCDRSGHRRSAPGLHASPATTQAGVLCGFPHPAQRLVRRQGSCYRGGHAHGCPQPRRRGLTRACTLCGGDGHRWSTRACPLCGGDGHRGFTRACALCGGNGHRGLTRTRALRYHGVGRGDWRIEDDSCLGFHRLRLHRHGQSGRRCGCVLLTGTDR